MYSLNANMIAMVSLNHLANANALITRSLARLSTGSRINSATDDPAGSAVATLLRSQVSDLNQAILNNQRASSMISTATDAMDEVATQLQAIRSLVYDIASDGTLTSAEIAAKQASIDAAVEAVNSIAGATTFNGTRLLDGSQDVRTSGVNAAQLAYVNIHSVRFGNASTAPINVVVTTSAQTAGLTYVGSTVTSATVLQVSGLEGTATLSFASGTAASAVVSEINANQYATGVSATLSGTNGIVFSSADYGSSAFVSIQATSGTFSVAGGNGSGTDYGVDVVGTINGRLATGTGLELGTVADTFSATITIDEDFGAGTVDSFYLTGGGLTFQTGAGAGLGGSTTLGVGSMHATQLGGLTGHLADIVSGGSTAATGSANAALKIVDDAIGQVSLQNTRLGAFQSYTLASTIAVLGTTSVQTSGALSLVADTDYAAETANLYRGQLLANSALSALQIGYSQAQGVLQLIRSVLN